MEKYSAKMAKLFVERENPDLITEPCIGIVTIAPPELTISIWDGQVTLYPSQLYMNDRLYNDYSREYEITGDLTEITINTTSGNTEAGPGPHKHQHGKISGTGKYKAIGTIINTDTLIVGDYVKVVPSQNGQMWFVDSKFRKVKP
ncbi:MAG: DUF2577 family protein [Fusobacteriaceae bacterium]